MLMKKTYFRRIMTWALTAVLAVSLLPTVSVAAPSDPGFARELAQLLKEDDTSGYFGSMELTIGSSTLTLDGAKQSLDVAPEIRNDRTMLPIRAVAENAGATVDYDAANRTVLISSSSGDEIRCPIGVSSIIVNDEVRPIDTASYIEKTACESGVGGAEPGCGLGCGHPHGHHHRPLSDGSCGGAGQRCESRRAGGETFRPGRQRIVGPPI